MYDGSPVLRETGDPLFWKGSSPVFSAGRFRPVLRDQIPVIFFISFSLLSASRGVRLLMSIPAIWSRI